MRVLQRVYWPGLKAFLPEQRSQYGRQGVDPLADEMLEDVRRMPETVRMPVDMPYRRPGGPHRFGEVGNATWDRLPGKGYYFGMSRPYVYQLMKEGLVKTARIKCRHSSVGIQVAQIAMIR